VTQYSPSLQQGTGPHRQIFCKWDSQAGPLSVLQGGLYIANSQVSGEEYCSVANSPFRLSIAVVVRYVQRCLSVAAYWRYCIPDGWSQRWETRGGTLNSPCGRLL